MAKHRIPAVLILLACSTAPVLADNPFTEADRACLKGDFDAALQIARRELAHHPDQPDFHVIVGRASIGKSLPAEAFAALREALRLDPGHADALYYTAKLSSLLAMQQFKAVLDHAPASSRANQIAGEAWMELGRYTEAEAAFRQALAADPKSATVLNELGDLRRLQNRCADAVTFYARARALQPNNFVTSYGLGVCTMQLGQPAKGEAEFRRALILDPASYLAHAGLGEALFRQNNFSAAVAELELGLKGDPSLKRTWFYLARAYQKLGDTEKSLAAFQRYTALSDLERPPIR